MVLKVTALDLIKHQEFAELQALLRLEFQPLSRLLLLLGWTQSRSLDSARTLLRILHQEQVWVAVLCRRRRPCIQILMSSSLLTFQAAADDSVLQEFADLLSSQLEILEWCKNSNP